MAYILIHGSGHKDTSWNETVSYMKLDTEIFCPDLSSLLNNKETNYSNLYSSFAQYCNTIEGQVHLCGLSLGGILALNYALDYPRKVKTLVLIGTPHKIPKLMFGIQNIIFKFLPESFFVKTAFNKKDMFIFGNSMKNLDFSDRIQNVTCPTLLICGKKDSANIKSTHYFAENIKNTKLVIMENTGHVINEENPKALAKELNDFYQSSQIT